MLLKLAVPLLGVSVSLFKINLQLAGLCKNIDCKGDKIIDIKETLSYLPPIIEKIDEIDFRRKDFISKQYPSDINIDVIFNEYLVDSSLQFKNVIGKNINMYENMEYYQKLYEIYDDNQNLIDIMNCTIKEDLRYIKKSLEIVIDSYIFMALFCKIHDNFINNNNKIKYKENFNLLFDRFFFRIKEKKMELQQCMIIYFSNRKNLTKHIQLCQ